MNNTILFLCSHPAYAGTFRFNEFAKQTIVARCPLWGKPESFRVRCVDDNDITNCAASLEKLGMTPDRVRVYNAIKSAAEKFSFNPAREYFSGLVWDGQARLDKWLAYYLGCDDDAPEYLAFIGKKWLTAAEALMLSLPARLNHQM